MVDEQFQGRLRFGLVAISLCWAPCSHGAWQAVPDIQLSAALQENARLEPDFVVTDDSARTVLDVGVDLSTYNERGFVTFTPRVQSHIYSDQVDQDLEGDDWYFDGSAQYRWQVVTLGFRGDYREQSVQRSELLVIEDPELEPDGEPIDDPDGADSGRLVFIDESRERLRMRPYMSFTLSERSTLRFQLNSDEVSYSGGSNVARTGFEDRSIDASVIRRVSDRSRVEASLIVSEYHADVNSNSTDTVGVQGTIRREVSDLWTVTVSAGVERSDFVFQEPGLPIVDNADVNPTFDLRATKRSERSTLELRIVRRLSPNSSGFLTEREEIGAFINRDLTQRLATRFGVRFSQSESVGDAAPINDRDYARAELGFTWALRERWMVTAGYDYIAQEFTQSVTGERTSSTIWMGIGYRGLRRPGSPR